MHHDIGPAGMMSCAAHPFGFHRIDGLAQPCGIDQRDRNTAKHHAYLERIAGGAGNGGTRWRPPARARRLSRLDLPTLGAPTIAKTSPLRSRSPASPLARCVCISIRRPTTPFISASLDLLRQILVREIDQRLLLRQQLP